MCISFNPSLTRWRSLRVPAIPTKGAPDVSFCLTFLWPHRMPCLLSDAYLRHFEGRANYSVDRGLGHAVYFNEDTGVHFRFDILPAELREGSWNHELAQSVDGLYPVGITFTLDYQRPHFFALEAAREIAVLTESFGLLVDDPHSAGVGRDLFDPDAFIRSWNLENRYGEGGVIGWRARGLRPASLPRKRLESIWQWNYSLPRLREMTEGTVTLPRILLTRANGMLVTWAAWGDALPVLLPRVDQVLVCRLALLPPQHGGALREPDQSLVPWDRVASALPRDRWIAEGPEEGHFALLGPSPHPAALELFKRIASSRSRVSPYPMNRVLETELLDEVLGASGPSRPAATNPSPRE